MVRSDIPQHVRDLIVRHIASVQQLEILVLLRSEPERDWSPAEVSRTLRIGLGPCAVWLDDLAAAGLLSQNGSGVRDARDALVDDLVDCYARRRLSVIEAVYSR